MSSTNVVILCGNLTRDPDIREISNGNTVASFTIALNRKWKSQTGEMQDEVTFVDCEAWGRTAELMGQYVHKGSQMVVNGRLKQDQWQDKDGNARSKLKVVCESIQFVGTRQTQPSGQQTATRGKPAPSPKPQPADDGDIPF